jgi:glutathione S-transferase
MRFMVQVRATRDTEAGVMPTTELMQAMMNFNEEMVNAGVMKTGDGLHPTSHNAARLTFEGPDAPLVTDGPFTETKELIAGFWIIETASFEEAVNWMRRAPMAPGDVLEIRQLFDAADFGEALTPHLREQWERLDAQEEGRG